MTLKEISNVWFSRYDEIYFRIDNHLKKLQYATNSACGNYSLDEWRFIDDDFIKIITSDYHCNENDTEERYIKCEYLENDEIFEKWLDDECSKREVKEAAQKKIEEQKKEERDLKLYQQLKDKFSNK